jgi:hypothetical protein
MKKEKKKWKITLVDRVNKKEWDFPTLAVGGHSGIVVEMTGRHPETGEGIGRVVVPDGDRYEGQIKQTWQLQNFTPVDGRIERVEILK